MIRILALSVAALLLLGARRPPSVDYRLGVDLQGERPPVLTVEMRFEGDADGETMIDLPDRSWDAEAAWRYVFGFEVQGASVDSPDPAHRRLRHRPGAKLVVRYRVQSAYDHDPQAADGPALKGPMLRPNGIAALGAQVFAVPEGRDREAATFHWMRLPKGWTAVSDLDHGEAGRWVGPAEVRESIALAGPDLATMETQITGGTLRVAALGGPAPDTIIKAAAPVIDAERAYWGEAEGPFFVAAVGLTGSGAVAGGRGLGDALALLATADAGDRVREAVTLGNLGGWIPDRLGLTTGTPAATAWFSQGVADFLAARILARAGLETTAETVERLGGALYLYDHSPVRTADAARVAAGYATSADLRGLARQRGVLLALKWDDDIRRKTGGKADLDDVLLRMRDHYRQFAPGQGPDLVTGLVSAVWVTAGIDLRGDLVRYVDRGEPIELPAEMYDGCLQARVTTSPAFDVGFDAEGSIAAHTVRGVRRRGPAWNSGLRDGMRLESWSYQAGDTSRQVQFTVRPAGRGRAGRARTIAYWPYGDTDAVSRRLQLTPGLAGEALVQCGRRLAGF